MSQANDLLNSLSGYDADLATVDPATEPHIVIGSDRFISVPSALKKIAVQHDNNVETVTFDCPRYWDGLDMSQMVIYINYKRPDGSLGACFATNVTIDAEDTNIMHFDWTITDHVTRYKGTLIFNVCIKKTDEYNRIINHWNSELNKEMTISEGLECDVIYEEKYPDVIAQLLVKINNLEKQWNVITDFTITDNSITDYTFPAKGYTEFLVFCSLAVDEEITSSINGKLSLNATNGPWGTGIPITNNLSGIAYSSSNSAKTFMFRFQIICGYIIPLMTMNCGNHGASSNYVSCDGGVTSLCINKNSETNEHSLIKIEEEIENISIGSYTKWFGKNSHLTILAR